MERCQASNAEKNSQLTAANFAGVFCDLACHGESLFASNVSISDFVTFYSTIDDRTFEITDHCVSKGRVGYSPPPQPRGDIDSIPTILANGVIATVPQSLRAALTISKCAATPGHKVA